MAATEVRSKTTIPVAATKKPPDSVIDILQPRIREGHRARRYLAVKHSDAQTQGDTEYAMPHIELFEFYDYNPALNSKRTAGTESSTI